MLKCDPTAAAGCTPILQTSYFRPQRLSNTTPMSKRQLASSSTSNLNDASGIELRHGLTMQDFVPVIYMTGNDDPAVPELRWPPAASVF